MTCRKRKRKAPPSSSSSSSSSPWSELPKELLSMIAGKLSVSFDFIRFRCVCSSWRSAAGPTAAPPSPPLLLLPHNPSSSARTFFSLATRTSRTLRLPRLRGTSVLGSDFGWLALIDSGTRISLLNPLTGTHIPLPAYSPPCGPRNRRPSLLSSSSHVQAGYPKKAFLSSNPLAGAHIMLTIAQFRGFAFCRIADQTWSWTFLHDVGLQSPPVSIFFQSDTFFAFDRTANGAAVDVESNHPRKIPHPHPMRILTQLFLDVPCLADGLFLVKAGAEIFMVQHGGHFRHARVTRFFRLDTRRGLEWVEVDGIGDRAFFVSWNHASAVNGSQMLGCEGGCIYLGSTFLDDHRIVHPGGVQFVDIIGMVGEDDSSLRDCKGFANATWFTPSLC